MDRFAGFFGMDSDEFSVGQEAGAAHIPANPNELKSAITANELGGPKSVVSSSLSLFLYFCGRSKSDLCLLVLGVFFQDKRD